MADTIVRGPSRHVSGAGILVAVATLAAVISSLCASGIKLDLHVERKPGV